MRENQMELRLVRTVSILQRKIEQLESRIRRISRLRGLIVLTGVIGYIALSQGGHVLASRLLVFITIGVFTGAVVWHNKVIRGKKRHLQYQQIKQQHIARLNRDWPTIPRIQADGAPNPTRFLPVPPFPNTVMNSDSPVTSRFPAPSRLPRPTLTSPHR